MCAAPSSGHRGEAGLSKPKQDPHAGPEGDGEDSTSPGTPDLPVGPVPGVPPEPAPAALRRRPSTIGGAVYLAVVAATAVGLLIIGFGPWRDGVVVIGIAALVAAVTRLVLNEFDGGMLRVRSKLFDVAVLTGTGVLLVVLARVIPNQVT